jgi:hypothetical protein
MPNTARGFTYPDSSGHTRLWEHIQNAVQSIDTFLTSWGSAWTAYSPTLSGITLGNGTLTAYYKKIGSTVHVRCDLILGSTTSFSGTTIIGLPTPVRTAAGYGQGSPIGAAFMYDSSAGSASRSIGTAVYDPTSGGAFFIADAGVATGNRTVLNSVPWTWASGDQLRFQGTYEADSVW